MAFSSVRVDGSTSPRDSGILLRVYGNTIASIRLAGLGSNDRVVKGRRLYDNQKVFTD